MTKVTPEAEWRREVLEVVNLQSNTLSDAVDQAGILQAQFIALRSAVQLLLEASPGIAQIASGYLDTMDRVADTMSPQQIEALQRAYQAQQELILAALNKGAPQS
jgi:hypothetical protein